MAEHPCPRDTLWLVCNQSRSDSKENEIFAITAIEFGFCVMSKIITVRHVTLNLSIILFAPMTVRADGLKSLQNTQNM